MLRKKIAFHLVTFICALALPASAQTQQDWDWVNKHFYDVLNELMPFDDYSLGYRSYRDLYTNELERSFFFNGDPFYQNLNATFRIADKVSVYDQMMELHRKKPTTTISEIKANLKIKEWQFSQSSCPAIKTQFEKFFRLSLEMMSSKERSDREAGVGTIALHPRIHSFNARITGGHLNLTITFGDHPFASWAEETFQALNSCAKKTNPIKK
ncbi:MAG: hypothetical protein SF097_15625 [Acidobacteriota bacterium]|nr:hypothetical protein [Acidobacteriota bacterium]